MTPIRLISFSQSTLIKARQQLNAADRAETPCRVSTVRWQGLMLGLGSFIALATQSHALETVSPTYAATALTVSGQSTSQPATTYLALQVVQPALSAGVAESISANTFSDSAAAWSADQFNGAAGAHFVEFDSGLMADIEATSNDTLTLAGDIEGLVQPGEAYRVRPHSTLDSVFGADNAAGLTAASNPSDADHIMLFNVQTQGTDIYWFSTIPGFEGWRNLLMQPAGSQTVYPEQGLMIQRKSPEDLLIAQNGQVKTGTTLVPIQADYNYLGTLKTRTTLTLEQLGLYTGDSATGIAESTNPTDADNLLIIDANGATQLYWYSAIGGFEGWRDVLMNPVGTTAIAPGSAFFLNRKSDTGFFWEIPAE